MTKGFFSLSALVMGLLCACSSAFILMYVTIVGLTVPQLPGWAQEPVKEWMLDIPQFSEHIEDDGSVIDNAPGGNPGDNYQSDNGNGSGSGNSMPALAGPVTWSGYFGPNGIPDGFPIWGAVHHPWGGDYDAPLIGCKFHDANYTNHTGFDSPVSTGTPLHSTMGGEVVWAGYTKGGWGRLVVVENGEYQIWMAHLSEIHVEVGQVVAPGEILGLSGGDRTQDDQAGNSSGAHLHYGIKKKTGPDTYVWVDPADYFDISQLTQWGCSK
jgi:murein DD-endopeptidase MepM/ murein hydrolase activator NlpD